MARLVIRFAAAVGALAALAGVWWTVAAMALVVGGQLLTLHLGERQLSAEPQLATSE